MTLDALLAEAEPHLVGLWKFRERGKPTTWCATVLKDGDYFDVDEGCKTVADVLEAVLEAVR